MYPQMLKISEQLVLIDKALEEFVTARNSKSIIVPNVQHLWQELWVLQDVPRLIIVFLGATPLSADYDPCRESREFGVCVVRGSGFIDPMSGGNKEPFTDSLETVRDIVRKITNISNFGAIPSVLYRGIKPLPNLMPPQAGKVVNAFADAFMLTFVTENDYPAVEIKPVESSEAAESE